MSQMKIVLRLKKYLAVVSRMKIFFKAKLNLNQFITLSTISVYVWEIQFDGVYTLNIIIILSLLHFVSPITFK